MKNKNKTSVGVPFAPLPEGATSRHREKGRDGGGLWRQTKEGTWDGKS